MEVFIIDPQNSFCCPTTGELYVNGADDDMERLAAGIRRSIKRIDDIHVTLDTHHRLDVAHPLFWVNGKGEHPAPFTLISKEDVKNGIWIPFNSKMPCPPYGTLYDRMINYVEQLEQNNRYILCIWPPHCLIGSPGHNVYEPIRNVLAEWEDIRYGMVNYHTKGSNIFTEHYSGVQADVPDPNDPSTSLNIHLIETLEEPDMLVFAGEASSHCIANTVTDIIENFGQEAAKKCYLLTDCMSPVPGFENVADKFFTEMSSKGVNLAKCDDIL